MRERAFLGLGAVVAVGLCLGLVGSAHARHTESHSAALVHVGLNPSSCESAPGAARGVVGIRFEGGRRPFKINISVHDALPNTTYAVDIRCVGAIGSLTSDSQGAAKVQIDVTTAPSNGFFVDLSVVNGGGGAGDYGDTFIAGPFDLN